MNISFFLKVLAGIGGGLLGTSASLALLVGLTAVNASVGMSLQSSEFSGTALVMMLFIAVFVTNISAVYFIIKTDPNKYRYPQSIMKGVFFLNVALFLISLPFYLTIQSDNFLLYIAGIHLFLSACSSALLAEIFSGVEYVLPSVIGISITQMLILLSYTAIGEGSTSPIVVILFLPFVWTIIPMILSVSEFITMKLQKSS